MPVYVRKHVEVDGRRVEVADRDLLARLTGYSAETIRKRCEPVCYDTGDSERALYGVDQVPADLEAANVWPRPHQQGPRQPNHPRRRNA